MNSLPLNRLDQAEADLASIRIACRELNRWLVEAASHGVLVKLNIIETRVLGRTAPPTVHVTGSLPL